jgi:hypothetical protein
MMANPAALFRVKAKVVSGGNFHGEYPAKAADYLAIAVHELASISERRIERLVNPALSNQLPAFLVCAQLSPVCSLLLSKTQLYLQTRATGARGWSQLGLHDCALYGGCAGVREQVALSPGLG